MNKSTFGSVLFAFIVCIALTSTPVFAQRGRGGSFRGGFVGGRTGFRSGFEGRGAFRGTFVGPGFRGGFVNRRFFPRNRFFFPRNRFFFGFGGFWGYPVWTYPYAYGWPYPYGYDYGYAPMPRYSPVKRAADYYLIAFKDHTIQAAVSFWVEGEDIHWISREHEEKQAPLSDVDRRFSKKLNRDRGLEFTVP
jgi:hypothetical protein